MATVELSQGKRPGVDQNPRNRCQSGYGAVSRLPRTPRWNLRVAAQERIQVEIQGRDTRGTGLADHVDVEAFHLSVGPVNEETA